LEYILKPVSSKEIVTLLQKTKPLIDEERFKKRNLIHLKKHFKESLPIIRNQFLNALILERHNIVDLEGQLMSGKIKQTLTLSREKRVILELEFLRVHL